MERVQGWAVRAEVSTEGTFVDAQHRGRGYTCRRDKGRTLRSQTCKGDVSTRTLVWERASGIV